MLCHTAEDIYIPEHSGHGKNGPDWRYTCWNTGTIMSGRIKLFKETEPIM